MLEITIPSTEIWDDENEEFIVFKGAKLQLEHSLISLSKWESKHKKAFLPLKEPTIEEIADYVRCMTINRGVDPLAYRLITSEQDKIIRDYINDSMTATVINHPPEQAGGSKDTLTSELIYYWMVSYNIPFDCQKWHLNRLLSLIDVCHAKNSPKKKYSMKDVMASNKALNAARKAKLHTKG